MDRLTREKAAAEQELATASATLTDLDRQLERALVVAGSCREQYVVAPPAVRRLIDQGFFVKLFIGSDGGVERAELTEPFAALLTEDAVEAIAAVQSDVTGGVVAEGEVGEAEGGQPVREVFDRMFGAVGEDGRSATALVWGAVCMSDSWYPGWDSNPHCRWFEHRLSAVGVPGPAGGAR